MRQVLDNSETPLLLVCGPVHQQIRRPARQAAEGDFELILRVRVLHLNIRARGVDGTIGPHICIVFGCLGFVLRDCWLHFCGRLRICKVLGFPLQICEIC